MGKLLSLILLVVLIGGHLLGCSAEPPLQEQLKELIPHATGLAHVEVVEVKEIDSRPVDGPLYLHFGFRILASSGDVRDHFDLTTDFTPMRPVPEKPTITYGIVKPDTFQLGKRYWIAFASMSDETTVERIVRLWSDQPSELAILEKAILVDHYAHRPHYHSKTGLTHSFGPIRDRQSCRVLMKREEEILWDVTLPGERSEDFLYQSLLLRTNFDSKHLDPERADWVLFVETVSRLEPDNRYQLPANNYRLVYALDAYNGQIAVIWVSRVDLSPISTPWIIQYFNQQNGAVRREERYEWVDQGGLAVGASNEKWYRKIVRTYAQTNTLNAEEVFRWNDSPHSRSKEKFLPINKL